MTKRHEIFKILKNEYNVFTVKYEYVIKLWG